MLVGIDSSASNRLNVARAFCQQLESDCQHAGLNISLCDERIHECREADTEVFFGILNDLIQSKATICVCMMISENIYGEIKYLADSVGILTQCLKWTNIKDGKWKRGYAGNVSLKVSNLLALPWIPYTVTPCSCGARCINSLSCMNPWKGWNVYY